MKIIIVVLGVLSFLIFSGCALFTSVGIAKSFEKGSIDFVGLAVFGVPMVFSIYCFGFLKKKYHALSLLGNESYVYKYALEHSGLITPMELASDGRFSIEESKALLEKMHLKGLCEKRVTADFIYVYGFKDSLSEEDKNNALKVTGM